MYELITEKNIKKWFTDETIENIGETVKNTVSGIRNEMTTEQIENSCGVDGMFVATVNTVNNEQMNLIIDYTAEWLEEGYVLNYGLAISDTIPDEVLDEYNDNPVKIKL